MQGEQQRTVPVTVMRGLDRDDMQSQSFDVPFVAGMSVLDALIWIRGHADPSLAIRYSCINANACKECSVMVNGQVEYACTARLTPAGAIVAPLENKTVIRDLVTDLAPSRERLEKVLASRR
ncbi:MAG: 2Fe-2S iron-sulfur cluster-binding protein [Jhaorihella sp.]